MKKQKSYYLGLDIGTDSVGYAVADEKYNLLKFHGEPAWGVTLFDEASLNDERRSFRSARRRLDRRQQRVKLLQELFAEEISKVDKRFFIRIEESYKYRDESEDRFILFNDADFNDIIYYSKYPTIHHLIVDLMKNKSYHDPRLVYLACSWLVAHRGHFLSNINAADGMQDFSELYNELAIYFYEVKECSVPWRCNDINALAEIIKKKATVTSKTKELIEYLYMGVKPSKVPTDDFPFSQEGIIKLLAGGKYALKDLFGNDEYAGIEEKSISLDFDDEKMGVVMSEIGDDYDLIKILKSIYDWSVLTEILNHYQTISESKVAVYNQHQTDLRNLKFIIKKYKSDKYDEVFRSIGKDNYAAYTYHSDEKDTSKLKKVNAESFSKYILGILKNIVPDEEDIETYNDMKTRLELLTFMPKQKNSNNRVIPHQLYEFELDTILNNAEKYLPFLLQKDEDGLTVSDKIKSIFLFKIPYFVGPLNEKSDKSWLVRKESGKILPWNFEEKVNLDESEEEFIKRMTNTCTYLPGETVLPKDSLLYHKFTVLNEINNLRINGEKVSVKLKQEIYTEVFLKKKKVTKKYLTDYLICNGYIAKGEENSISGIDTNINSNLSIQIAFKNLLESGTLTETDIERIIERASYAEDKTRLSKWILKEYPSVSDADRKYICNIKIRDFGRLSRMFLDEIEGINKSTGEITTIIGALWDTQFNLMELLSDKFTFAYAVNDIRKEYYSEHKFTLKDKLDEMYISNSVKRPVYRTLAVIKDVEKAFGTPKKIFVEMTRGATEEQKHKRTSSRKEQILELYKQCKDTDVKMLMQQLEAMGDSASNKLQSDKLFLYYMQLGKSMYSGKPISLESLSGKTYDIDHIYPQAYVKDDSIINNKVLVLSEENGAKSDRYPIEESIRKKMQPMWKFYLDSGLISEEKYKRLTRATTFTDDEKYGLINRQLVETSQSAKAVAELLKEKYPDSEIVYCKAKLTSEFRQEFDMLKSRIFNDLHHAKDAYLNIVTGNVYNMKFTKPWFNIDSKYSIKTKTLFGNTQICNGISVWNGDESVAKVRKTLAKNNAHFTKFSIFKTGGLFDQQIVSAAPGLTPIKKSLPTERYGGYKKAGIMFYVPVKYTIGQKSETIIMSVEMLHADKFLADAGFAKEYSFARLKHILGKDVDELSFPLGMRPWKVNTMLSLDGFRVCITGIASGGKCLIAQNVMQFAENSFWEFYIKKLEMFAEKVKKNPNFIYSEQYDNINTEKNMELYDIYISKLSNTIFKKRINNPVNILINGKVKFEGLDIKDQAQALLNIHQVFGRIAGGCDLTLIGGAAKAAATVSFSSSVSNWKKNYSDVRLIDSSASGLWQKRSENLLEIL